ncbi:hypothetical protein J4G37_01595 [Microvirga sp. 3-52]|nr:hypothetical protein [Microvirga sp. 3-52]
MYELRPTAWIAESRSVLVPSDVITGLVPVIPTGSGTALHIIGRAGTRPAMTIMAG